MRVGIFLIFLPKLQYANEIFGNIIDTAWYCKNQLTYVPFDDQALLRPSKPSLKPSKPVFEVITVPSETFLHSQRYDGWAVLSHFIATKRKILDASSHLYNRADRPSVRHAFVKNKENQHFRVKYSQRRNTRPSRCIFASL